MLYAYPRVLLKYEGERESVMETNSTTPGIGKLHIDAGTTGVDPALAAMFSNRNDGLMGGGLLPLLIGAFLFSGRGGLFGGNGAVAAEAVTSSKDVMAQLNTFQTWASTNAAQLAQGIAGIDKSICCSSAQIIQAVNALTPQMYQQFSQAAMHPAPCVAKKPPTMHASKQGKGHASKHTTPRTKRTTPHGRIYL